MKKQKMFSCESVKFIAASTVMVETDRGSFEIKKGSSVLVSVNEDQNPVILRKGLVKEGNKYTSCEYFVEIQDKDIFKDFMEEVVISEDEISHSSKSITLKSLNKFIVQDGLKVENLIPYAVNNNVLKIKENKKSVSLPVLEKVKLITPYQRMSKLKALEDLAKNPNAKRAIIRGLKYENKSFKNNGFIINEKKINEEFEVQASDSMLMDFIYEKLSQSLDPNKYTLNVVNSSLKVLMNGSEIGSFDFADENYTVNGIDADAFAEVQELVSVFADEYFNDFDYESDIMATESSKKKSSKKEGKFYFGDDYEKNGSAINDIFAKVADLISDINENLTGELKGNTLEVYVNTDDGGDSDYICSVDIKSGKVTKSSNRNVKLNSKLFESKSSKKEEMGDGDAGDYDKVLPVDKDGIEQDVDSNEKENDSDEEMVKVGADSYQEKKKSSKKEEDYGEEDRDVHINVDMDNDDEDEEENKEKDISYESIVKNILK